MVVNQDYPRRAAQIIHGGVSAQPANVYHWIIVVRCFDSNFGGTLSKLLYDRLRLCRHMANYEFHRLMPRSALPAIALSLIEIRAGVACGRLRLTPSRHPPVKLTTITSGSARYSKAA